MIDIERNLPQPKETIPTQTKPKNKFLTCLIGLIVAGIIFVCLVLVSIIFVLPSLKQYIYNQNSKNIVGNETNNSLQPTIVDKHVPQNFDSNTEKSSLIIEDIYNDQLTLKPADQINVTEMDLLRYILENAVTKGWGGTEKSKLPITKSDFPQEKINQYAENNTYLNEKFVIPTNLRPVFLDGNAPDEITQIIYSARKEYLEYLNSKGVLQKYIDEIDSNTLPESTERIIYHAVDGYDNPPSAVEGLKNANGDKEDFSKLQMDIYGGDVYNHTRTVVLSELFGPVPSDTDSQEYVNYYKHAREMGIRYLIYHEMSHVLQRAFDTQNTEEKYKTQKSSWISAERSMWEISDKYFVKWDPLESFTDVENHNLSQESQAEGISYEILTKVYNMSPIQKKILWEYFFGRLDTARDNYTVSMKIFADNFPNYPITSIDNQVYNDFVTQYTIGSADSSTLYEVESRMGNLSTYGGYFNPVLPEDMPALWAYLKK